LLTNNIINVIICLLITALYIYIYICINIVCLWLGARRTSNVIFRLFGKHRFSLYLFRKRSQIFINEVETLKLIPWEWQKVTLGPAVVRQATKTYLHICVRMCIIWIFILESVLLFFPRLCSEKTPINRKVLEKSSLKFSPFSFI